MPTTGERSSEKSMEQFIYVTGVIVGMQIIANIYRKNISYKISIFRADKTFVMVVINKHDGP